MSRPCFCLYFNTCGFTSVSTTAANRMRDWMNLIDDVDALLVHKELLKKIFI